MNVAVRPLFGTILSIVGGAVVSMPPVIPKRRRSLNVLVALASLDSIVPVVVMMAVVLVIGACSGGGG